MKKKKNEESPLVISPAMKEDIEREESLKEVGPFSHWLDDLEDEEELEGINMFSHWSEDEE